MMENLQRFQRRTALKYKMKTRQRNYSGLGARKERSMSGDRKTGVVKWFNSEKKFGFITDDESGEDCFVHVSELNGLDTLEPEQRVNFETVEGAKGSKALDVKLD